MIGNKSSTEKIWLRRGTFKKRTSVPVDSFDFFDSIIHPTDSNNHKNYTESHKIKTNVVSPISLIDKNEMLTKENVLQRFGIPSGSKVFYVQLGAGKINDINSEIRMVIDAILEDELSYVVLGESLLGDRLSLDIPRVRTIRDYPNCIYFNGFDFSVQAGGYNSFHEMRIMQIPTLFLPNLETGMDDQMARCVIAEDEGWGVVDRLRTKNSIKEALQQLPSRNKMTIDYANGADEVAAMILGDLNG